MSMDFTIEFYETASGACPVREFLDELKLTDPNDFAAVVAGLAKLRTNNITANHWPKRSAAGCSSYAMWASSIPASCGFS